MKSKTLFYKQALKILQAGTYDQKAVCLKLAQERPEVFCSYVERDLDPFTAEIVRLGKGGLKIQAIKDYRAKYSTGLYDSKVAVEKIWKDNGIE